MKRIEFIQPVESMRGNFGAKQDLRYAENDNKAFESPDGKTNYARNYQPTFIGAKIARTGLKYFAVKVKSATTNSAAWRLVAALMGAMSAIYGWVIKQSAIVLQLNVQYAAAIENGYKGTFHKYVGAAIRESLAAKLPTIRLVGPTATVTLGNNPFSSAAEAIAISKAVLTKFWTQLCPNGISFKIGNSTAIAITGNTFMNIAAERANEEVPIPEPKRIDVVGLYYNVKDLQDNDKTYVRHGDQYLADADGYAVQVDTDGTSTVITAGAQFLLVDEQPPYRA